MCIGMVIIMVMENQYDQKENQSNGVALCMRGLRSQMDESDKRSADSLPEQAMHESDEVGQSEKGIARIYGLRVKGSDTVWYVGATTRTLLQRRNAHIVRPCSAPLSAWIASHPVDDIEIVLLETCPIERAGEREDFHIKDRRQDNPRLLNVYDARESKINLKQIPKMRRFQVFLSETERLRKLGEETGLSVAEHIRRAIDEYLRRLK